MYIINYSLDHNKNWEKYNFLFNSLWAAVFKARAVCEEHWVDVNVMDNTTGFILVSFNCAGGYYVDEELPEDIKKLASLPIE